MHGLRCVTTMFTLAITFVQPATAQEPLDLSIEVTAILEHDDGEFLWFHPRVSVIPDNDGHVVLTLQKHLQQSDYYSGLHVMHSRDGGATWTQPDPRPELAWRSESEDVTIAVCDVTPGWHAPTKMLLAIGTKVRYREGNQLLEQPQSHAAAYAIYNPAAGSWSTWNYMDMPDSDGKLFLVTPGCVQWHVKPDGRILVPFYFKSKDEPTYHSTVMECNFDGASLTYLRHGTELSLDVERGLVEPSLIYFGDKYYLTIRNDKKAYVTSSTNGLEFDPIVPWTFDDGAELGSYNTQQHWLTVGGRLYLVYTRRGANNDHIMRNRAPLFIAEVDTTTLTVRRATERVVIPERGATLGNFGVCHVSPTEAWVTVSEGVWNDDARARGATGATFIAKVTTTASTEQ